MATKRSSTSLAPLAYAAFTTLLAVFLGLGVLFAGTEAAAEDPAPGLRFSHRLHTQDMGMGCTDCHSAVEESTVATEIPRPDHMVCQSCHEEQLNDDCATCHLSDPMEYVVPVREDRGLVFSHSFHIGQGVECTTCHSNMPEREAAAPATLPSMQTCVTCHNEADAPKQCESCHSNLALLRPEEHNSTDFLRHHKQLALQVGATCGMCHSEETCQECHNGSDLVSVTVPVPGPDLQVSNGARLFAISRGQGQTKMKVHDAGFRFTHGIAAQQKTLECQTCHESQEFCGTCHFEGGNINQGAFKPANHEPRGTWVPQQTAYGVGGGRHAQEARRDIELCASCHDVQGADPTCVTCHFDSDGIRGTNPRTHEPGFMRGEEGDWHEDPGANCYICHVDPNAHPGGVRSLSFCGYCHN